jgi:hypothetical protein
MPSKFADHQLSNPTVIGHLPKELPSAQFVLLNPNCLAAGTDAPENPPEARWFQEREARNVVAGSVGCAGRLATSRA